MQVASGVGDRVQLILCHFGGFRFSVEPALSSFLRYFPQAHVTLYTDNKNFGYPDAIADIREVCPPYDSGHPRYGWRSSDLYRAIGLLESKAEFAVYSDSDMVYCSEKVLTFPALARRFGLLVPANPRLLVKYDVLLGADSNKQLDGIGDYGFAWNSAPLFFHTASAGGRALLERFQEIMLSTPLRSPTVLYKAALDTNFSPYTLPFQWCVCEEHLGVGDEIVLHVGHKRVQDYYLGKEPRWLKEIKRTAFMLKSMYFPGKKRRAATDFWIFP